MAHSQQNVLVVDDDADIRASLVILLTDEGYIVHEAPDGQPALDLLRQSRQHMVVLLDLQMPNVDGVAVLEAIASHEALATRHAIIVMTARGGRGGGAQASPLAHRVAGADPRQTL